MKIRIFILALVLSSHVFAVETIQGVMNSIWAQAQTGDAPLGSYGFQVVDKSGAFNSYVVRVCLSLASVNDATWNCAGGGQSTTFIANCPLGSVTGCGTSQNHGTWSPSSGVVGSLDPRDGQDYAVHFWVIAKGGDTQLLDVQVDNSPQYFTWDAGNSTFLRYDIPITTTSTPMTAAKLGVMVNRSDPYSIGSAGADVCVSGADHVKDDGVAGYEILAHSIPCANAIIASMTVADEITVANFNTAWQTGLNSWGSGIQGVAIGWFRPTVVTGGSATTIPNCESQGTKQPCYGMAAWVTMYPNTNGVEPTGTACVQQTYGLGWGPDNPQFNNGTSSTYWTGNNSTSIRPAMMLAAGTCAACSTSNNTASTWTANFATMKAAIDAAVAAKTTNPSGTAQLSIVGTTYSWNQAIPPSALNSGIDSHLTTTRLGTAASPVTSHITAGTTTNCLYYNNGSQSWNYDTAGSGTQLNCSSGVGYAEGLGSVTGQALTGGNLQTPYHSWLGGNVSTNVGGFTGTPMVAAGGTAVEPCEAVALKHPSPLLFLSYYTAGWTVNEAMWKAQRQPWNWNATGDPLAQPFSAKSASLTGGKLSGGGNVFGGAKVF